MRRCLPFLLATSSLCAISVEAGAADLRMPTKAPPAPVVRYATWTGCYIGANVGYGWARFDYSIDPANPNLLARAPDQKTTGIVGGGQVGCDYQFDPFVIGIQGMFDGASLSGTGDPYLSGKVERTSVRARVPWFATLTGRVGLPIQDLLLYVKGGAAWAHTDFHFAITPGTVSGSGDLARSGWTVGIGGEWRFAPNFSLFLEYGHLDFGSRVETFALTGGGSFRMNVKQSIDLVLVGLNYRFGAAPVVARY